MSRLAVNDDLGVKRKATTSTRAVNLLIRSNDSIAVQINEQVEFVPFVRQQINHNRDPRARFCAVMKLSDELLGARELGFQRYVIRTTFVELKKLSRGQPGRRADHIGIIFAVLSKQSWRDQTSQHRDRK